MSISSFLKTRLPLIAILTMVDVATCVMVLLCGVSMDVVIMVAGCLLAGLVAVLVWDYRRNAAFLSEAKMLSEHLEHPYQLASLMNEPSRKDQALLFDALRTMGEAASNEISQLKENISQEREYMEAWVHEVKTPLAAAQLVADRLPEPDSSSLTRELDRAGREVEQVLWYARSLSFEKDYVIRQTPLARVVKTVCKNNARLLIERGVLPVISIPDDVLVFTDEKQAAFVVSQLVVNSAKYGAARIEFSCDVSKGDTGDTVVVLSVIDDGMGIPSNDLDRVFDRGFTGQKGRQVCSSTGMGLYLAATVCEKLGVRIAIASQEGKGTKAVLTFPFDGRRFDMEAK